MAVDHVIFALLLSWTLADIIAAGASVECNVDEVRCCATEFYPLINADSGFNLDEESINRSCTVLDPTFNCLTEYTEQCFESLEEEDLFIINEAKNFLTDLCSSGSKLRNDIQQKRQCIMATSKKLQSCASKKDFQKDNPWSKPCCEYSMLKACAEATVKENCGDEEEVLVRDLVVKIDGIGYETACKTYYDTCGTAAITPLSAMFIVFVSIFSPWLGRTL